MTIKWMLSKGQLTFEKDQAMFDSILRNSFDTNLLEWYKTEVIDSSAFTPLKLPFTIHPFNIDWIADVEGKFSCLLFQQRGCNMGT